MAGTHHGLLPLPRIDVRGSPGNDCRDCRGPLAGGARGGGPGRPVSLPPEAGGPPRDRRDAIRLHDRKRPPAEHSTTRRGPVGILLRHLLAAGSERAHAGGGGHPAGRILVLRRSLRLAARQRSAGRSGGRRQDELRRRRVPRPAQRHHALRRLRLDAGVDRRSRSARRPGPPAFRRARPRLAPLRPAPGNRRQAVRRLPHVRRGCPGRGPRGGRPAFGGRGRLAPGERARRRGSDHAVGRANRLQDALRRDGRFSLLRADRRRAGCVDGLRRSRLLGENERGYDIRAGSRTGLASRRRPRACRPDVRRARRAQGLPHNRLRPPARQPGRTATAPGYPRASAFRARSGKRARGGEHPGPGRRSACSAAERRHVRVRLRPP